MEGNLNPNTMIQTGSSSYLNPNFTPPNPNPNPNFIFPQIPESSEQHSTKALVSDEEETMGPTEKGTKKGATWHRMKWTDKMVRLLITAVSYTGEDTNIDDNTGLKRKFTILQKKGKWKAISKVMGERGCYVSPQQCEDKFNDLNKRYKRLTDILGRGTSCKVVENPNLLERMNISEKLKDDARKILSSKHLFYEEMCSYHNGNRFNLPADLALQKALQMALRNRDDNEGNNNNNNNKNNYDINEINEIIDEDDEEEDEEEDYEEGYKNNNDNKNKNNIVCCGKSNMGRLDINEAFLPESSNNNNNNNNNNEKLQLERQKLQIETQMLELERQRFKWERFSKKKDRELQRMYMQNERMRLENERMSLELKHKELDLDLHKCGAHLGR